MNPISGAETRTRVISVSELNRLARGVVEQNLPLMWVVGEISNFTRAASGHCYFSLKDAQAQVRCVMFRHKAVLHDWRPENGMQVEVRAYPTFYEPRGEFQLNIEVMRRSGLGALYEAFEKLKARLQAEGLFDAVRKRALPRFPRAIGIVTSLQAAALRDVLTTLKRRMAAIPVIVYPTAVQGDGAAIQIAAAIAGASARAECDVLIVCRGGGSIEDLWPFNEEAVARAIRACCVPVVCGIGHETDFTIADFAADARAPTPTAAAQMASPARDELDQMLRNLAHRLARVTERILERCMQQLDGLTRRLVHPGARIDHQRIHLGHLSRRAHGAWIRVIERNGWRLRELHQQWLALRPNLAQAAAYQDALAQRLASAATHRFDALGADLRRVAAQLAQLDPRSVLARGYSMVETPQGVLVRDSSQLSVDDEVRLTFARGWAKAQVREKG